MLILSEWANIPHKCALLYMNLPSVIIFGIMKVVIAPQAFKGSISALDVAKAMGKGVKLVVPDAEIAIVPVADGGDGTLETLVCLIGIRSAAAFALAAR